MCLGLTVNFHLGMKSGQAHMFSSLYLVLPVAFTRVLFTRVQGARFLNNFFFVFLLVLVLLVVVVVVVAVVLVVVVVAVVAVVVVVV